MKQYQYETIVLKDKISWLTGLSMALNDVPDLELYSALTILHQWFVLGKFGNLAGNDLKENQRSILLDLYNRCLEELSQRHPARNFLDYSINQDNFSVSRLLKRNFQHPLTGMEDPIQVDIFKQLFKDTDKAFLFFKPPSKMRHKINNGEDLTMDKIMQHARRYPKGITAKVLKLMETQLKIHVSPHNKVTPPFALK